MDVLILIPFDERSGLVVVNVEALLYRLLVVVRASALLAALHEAHHQLVLRNVELYHCGNFVSTLVEHLLQSLCLWDSARESVEYHSLMLLAERVVYAGENVYHQLVRNELTLVDVSLGSLAKFSFVFDLISEHVTSRDVSQSVLPDKEIALCALS